MQFWESTNLSYAVNWHTTIDGSFSQLLKILCCKKIQILCQKNWESVKKIFFDEYKHWNFQWTLTILLDLSEWFSLPLTKLIPCKQNPVYDIVWFVSYWIKVHTIYFDHTFFPDFQFFLDPLHIPTHPTLCSFLFLPFFKNQTKTKQSKMRQKVYKKNIESILCWPTAPLWFWDDLIMQLRLDLKSQPFLISLLRASVCYHWFLALFLIQPRKVQFSQ